MGHRVAPANGSGGALTRCDEKTVSIDDKTSTSRVDKRKCPGSVGDVRVIHRKDAHLIASQAVFVDELRKEVHRRRGLVDVSNGDLNGGLSFSSAQC